MALFEQVFTLQVPSSTQNLQLIREFVGKIAQNAGLFDSEVSNLELAVDEACANVIEHAYGHDISKEVSIRMIIDKEQIVDEVIDSGHGFDPNQVPDLEVKDLIKKRKTGGLGMRLIKQLMDEVHYEIEPGKKNELRMVKKRKQA